MTSSVNIVVEDSLSEIVLRRLINHRRRDLIVGTRYPLRPLPGGPQNPQNKKERRGLSGYGQIKVLLPAFNKAAQKGQPCIVLTDLDVHVSCPGQLLPLWLCGTAVSRNLLFRIAVKEVEAWLLADRKNLADFLEVDETMVPRLGSTAEVGRCFERSLIGFVHDRWDVNEAAKNSESLKKALKALSRFKPFGKTDSIR